MRARQIAGAHQELADDLAAGEAKRALEEPDPLRLGARVVRVEPAGERAVRRLQLEDPPRVGDGRVHLEAVPHDAGIREEAPALAGAVPRHRLDVEAVIGAAERLAL